MLTETKVSGQIANLYGIMAEFDDPESLLEAARRAHSEGYRDMDAYTPMPVEGLAEAIGFRSNWVQRLVFVVVGMLALNGLPQPYHPVFNVEEFARASRDKFFLCIEASDPMFDPDATRQFLEHLNPREVMEVAR